MYRHEVIAVGIVVGSSCRLSSETCSHGMIATLDALFHTFTLREHCDGIAMFNVFFAIGQFAEWRLQSCGPVASAEISQSWRLLHSARLIKPGEPLFLASGSSGVQGHITSA
jgi:hypothetical protein